MLVYHGSKHLFETFDYKKIGTNATLEGKGFYFTDDIPTAMGYAQEGFLYTVEFTGKKLLSSNKKTITPRDLRQYLVALDEATDYLANWGDVTSDGINNVLNEAVRGELDGSENDVDVISGIANTSGDMETSLTLLHKVLGYDSIVHTIGAGQGEKIYIALTTDIITIVNVKSLKKN